MIEIRRASERGHANHGWLDTWHTFSFAHYYDPKYLGFRDLLVINDDTIQPGRGFGRHPHRDMEIITYVLEGELEHQDSTGGGSVLRPGDVQHMSAGTGVVHSEFNHSKETVLHLLQIWITPKEEGIEPGYEDKTFPIEERINRLRVIASPDGKDGSLRIHQEVSIYASVLDSGNNVELAFGPGRHGWIQVAKGAIEVNGTALSTGDGAAISEEERLAIRATNDSEFLVFDLS